MDKQFIDSNIWLYRLLIDSTMEQEESEAKRQIAIKLTQVTHQNIIITTQVITETCAVLKRKTQISDKDLLELIEDFEAQCEVLSITTVHIKQACQLRMNYYFSYWDSLLVATALWGNATILYSEDMQHNLLVENQLRIINPFLELDNKD